MSEIAIVGSQRYEVHICITCGVTYAVPEALIAQHRQEGGYHTCFNGHSQGWSKERSELEKLRRERDRLKQNIAQKDDEISYQRSEREATERRLYAAKGQVTKIKNRVGHGVCPCCTRSFGNLQRHMQSQHPDYSHTSETVQ